VSTEVASTRLPQEILREVDREATARGLSRSVYLAELIERSTMHASVEASGHAEALRTALAGELREIRESQRSVVLGLRDVQSALKNGGPSAISEAQPPLYERLTFSTFFSEALIKRVTALLHRNPGELSQIVREAREQAEAEARLWRERLQRGESAKGPS
jgi:predicted transcriptional regulator